LATVRSKRDRSKRETDAFQQSDYCRVVALAGNPSVPPVRRQIQWAADTYPVAQKYADTARTLENATKNRSTN
jgi:hypothetical protein